MKYFKSFLLTLLAFVMLPSAYAADDRPVDGVEVDEGTYFLYNVATKRYLCAGANWSTHAALENVPSQTLSVALNNGYYELCSFLDGKDVNFLGSDGSQPYMDMNKSNRDVKFIFEEASAEGFDKAYYVKHAKGYLTPNSNLVVMFTTETSEESIWVLISIDELNAKMTEAISEEGVEATHLIKLPGFQHRSQYQNDSPSDGRIASGLWMVTSSGGDANPGPNNYWGGSDPSTGFQFWNNSFDINQTLNNIPNGRYQMTVQGFNKIKGDGAKTDENYGFYYANEVEGSLMPMIEGGEQFVNAHFPTTVKYMLNNPDLWVNAPLTVDVSENMLKIGAKRTVSLGYDWTVLDNFRLTFFGNKPILEELVAESDELLKGLDEKTAADFKPILDKAKGVLAGDADQAALEEMIQELQSAYNAANALSVAKELATNVLNQVPYSLFPKNFNWDEPTYLEKNKKGKYVEVPVKGMSGADYNRTFKIYKNMAGKYQLASRLYVAILARLLEFVDADQLAQKEIGEYFEKLYEEKGEPWPGIEDMMADALKYYARCVVESHGIGAALYEQNDPNYSRMYDAITDYAYYSKFSYAYWWLYAYNYDYRAYDGLDVTLSDTYEMIHNFIGSGAYEYYSGKNYFGFDPNLTAHILDPNLEDLAVWNISDGFEPDSGESLTDAESSLSGNNTAGVAAGNDYPYLTLTGVGKGDVNQTITLPAGRYMLTVAGRASKATMMNNSFNGPFTEVGAQAPSRYFQLYAKNAQGERAQSIVPQEGSNESAGVFGYGWNDASLFFTMPSIGEVTLGVRAQTDVEGAEASFTRFRLTRLGDPTLFFDEYQTYETELNWDPTSFFFGTAPVDVVLHKKLTPGKWQSIAVPVDLSAEELLEHFGEGTKLAVPTAMVEIDPDEKEMLVNFTSWDVAASKQGLVQTKIYGYGMDWWTEEYENYYDYPAGMIANVPYLINPAKVNANNMYVFHNVTSSETHGMRYTLNEDEDVEDPMVAMSTLTGWSWGGFGVASGEDGLYYFSERAEDPKLPGVVFRPNYKYTKETPDNYTIEFRNTQNAFSGEFACTDGYKVVSAWIDGGYEIVTDQLNDMLAVGKSEAEKYSGIPTAMKDAMTFDPQIEGDSGLAGFLTTYTDGVAADDNKSWTSKDGKITITADDETSSIYYNEDTNEHFQRQQLTDHYLWLSPGKYTIKANNQYEYIYGYEFSNLWADTNDEEFTFTKSNGEKVSLGSDYGYIEDPKEIAETGNIESSVSFVLNGNEDARFAPNFEFDLLYIKEYTDYSMVEFFMFLDATKNVRNAMIEARKAYPLSNEFHNVYAEAEDLLNSEHTELVEGADAAFKKLLAAYMAAFNQLTKADDISALTEKLREEIEKYKTQIDQGLRDLEAGMHLFYNVGAKKYLGGSNNWGTQASLTTHGELMEVSKLEDGKYTIETRFTNGNNFHGFAKDHNGIYYMDAAATGAPLEIVCVEPGIYTISDGNGYLGYNGKNTVLGAGLTDADEENILWVIISEEELLNMMAEEASVEDPMDVTFLIKDPDFSRGHRDVAAWTFTWDGGNGRLNASSATAPADMYNYSAEAWQATFDLSQELEVPDGVYVMKAQGAVTDYTGAYDGVDYPVFFANDETKPFLSMEEEHRATPMLTLQKAFSEGLYFAEPIVVKVTDGKLTVGAKGTRTDLWATWDNFTLYYYGDVSVDDVKDVLSVSDWNETNGVRTIDNGELTNDSWYSIDGVKLQGKPTQRGLYIVNGKKVLVK